MPDLGGGAQNPENLRGYYFAKSEEGGGQTHCVQTVSSPFFNAKSYPLRFSRNLCNAPRPGTTAPDTSQAEGERKRRKRHLLKSSANLLDIYWLDMIDLKYFEKDVMHWQKQAHNP